MRPVEKILRDKISSLFAPSHVELNNESSMHGLSADAEKHFRLILVSEVFDGLNRVERHRLVNQAVAEELKSHVHALSIQAFSPMEWRDRQGKTFNSPECLGGGKRERGEL